MLYFQMSVERILIFQLVVFAAANLDHGGDQPAKGSPSPLPPWQRYLKGSDAEKAKELEGQIEMLAETGKLTEALKAAETLAGLRERVQGKDHWEAESARWDVKALRNILDKDKNVQDEFTGIFAARRQADDLMKKSAYRDAMPILKKLLKMHQKVYGEEDPNTAASYANLAINLRSLGKYADAEEGFRKAIAISRKALGEEHPNTASAYHNMATCLEDLGKFAEAEQSNRKALAIRLKVLGEEDRDTLDSYNGLALSQKKQGKYAEAEVAYRKALAICRKVLGEEDRLTAQLYHNLAHDLYALSKYPGAEEAARKAIAIRRKVLGEEDPLTATSYNILSHSLTGQGRYTEAEEGYRKALSITLKVLGEDHSATATCYTNLASILQEQGKYSEAEEFARKALIIWRRILGEQHVNMVYGYFNLANSQIALGKYAEAEECSRIALAIRRKVFGEENAETAIGYFNLAATLEPQGKHSEAEESNRKALAIRRIVFGEENADTAHSYTSLALTLYSQGKYLEAEELCRKSLAIFRMVLGEEHSYTAACYGNLSAVLTGQERYAEAEKFSRTGLALLLKVLGKENAHTAASYNNLATSLNLQGKYVEAGESLRNALDINRKVFGEDHPATATSYSNLATNLKAQGKFREAEEDLRKALAINRKVLGNEHADTAMAATNLAAILKARGEYEKAEEVYSQAAVVFAKARPRISATGLDRAAITGERSPVPSLAAMLARNNKPAAAWQRYEESIGRGAWDELSARVRRSPKEQAHQVELSNQLARLDQLIEQGLLTKLSSDERKKHIEALLSQRLKVQDELTGFQAKMEKQYGPVAGQVFDIPTIQAALPPDTALVGWLDLPADAKASDPNEEHWAFVLLSQGLPVVVRLKGSGANGAWTDADSRLPGELRKALQEHGADWKSLADRLRKQRMDSLESYLSEIYRLVILPSTALAGIPVEIIADKYVVSYALSGTMYSFLKKQPAPSGQGLLVVADPVFDRPRERAGTAPPRVPPGGLLITVVVPGSNAHKCGLKPGDVLLRYADEDLKTSDHLSNLIEAHQKDANLAVTVWREDREKPFSRSIQPGRLGVVLASQPAPQALAKKREGDILLAKRSGNGDKLNSLPNTRVEAEALRRLFEGPSACILLDSDASEQQLYERAKNGELGKYRYIHLATHGVANSTLPLKSAIILSRDNLPDPGKQLDAGLPVFDGELTAEDVLRQWRLNADLVALSACQTALGKHEGGEGFVGFAQALTLAGSRSVCLSLWNVNDTATALLMKRFYENLLGKRAGLKEPMKKAAALAEAKSWLQQLSRDEALKLTAEATKGVARGKRPSGSAAKEDKLQETMLGDHPYSHPYFWAAFVLFGDGD